MSTRKPIPPKRHIDLLLLSIIRAYEHPDRKSDEVRLADVREALFGEKHGRGRLNEFDDLALFNIGKEVRKKDLDDMRQTVAKSTGKPLSPEQLAEIDREPMSLRGAARNFQHLAPTKGSVESTEDRLRRKAGTKPSDRDMAEMESLFDPENWRTRTTKEILQLLCSLGVQYRAILDIYDNRAPDDLGD